MKATNLPTSQPAAHAPFCHHWSVYLCSTVCCEPVKTSLQQFKQLSRQYWTDKVFYPLYYDHSRKSEQAAVNAIRQFAASICIQLLHTGPVKACQRNTVGYSSIQFTSWELQDIYVYKYFFYGYYALLLKKIKSRIQVSLYYICSAFVYNIYNVVFCLQCNSM